MESPESSEVQPPQPPQPFQPLSPKTEPGGFIQDDLKQLKQFFQLTGGSIFYCLSAVFVAYGIVRIIQPILSEEGHTIFQALPCLLTLGVYEFGLLGVLLLIVSRRVVDDAISLVILIALFLVGTSLTHGSVASLGIRVSLYIGIGGMVLSWLKFYLMRRFAGIPFGTLSMAGGGVVMACNYIGPVFLASRLARDPSNVAAYRTGWEYLWVILLIGTVMVIVEAARGAAGRRNIDGKRAAFLQSPIMVYVFFLILILASGVQQYSLSYMLVMKRVLGDYVPPAIAASLLLMEIARHTGKKFGAVEVCLSCTGLAAAFLSIYMKSFAGSLTPGIGILFYPPVQLALGGGAVALWATYRKQTWLYWIVLLYGIGVILTAGISPENPHDLNNKTFVGLLIVFLMLYGIMKRKAAFCLAGLIIFSIALLNWEAYSRFVTELQLKKFGSVCGIFGVSSLLLSFIFVKEFRRPIRVIGVLCTAIFIFEYLPAYFHLQYFLCLAGMALIMAGLWFRVRDPLLIAILWLPFLIRLYILGKQIAHWRYVIIGFLLLGGGAIFSLIKQKRKTQVEPEEIR
jgi:hypothetical protein